MSNAFNIGIVGQGFVGSAIFEGLKNFYNVRTFDIDSSKCNSTHEEVCQNSDVCHAGITFVVVLRDLPYVRLGLENGLGTQTTVYRTFAKIIHDHNHNQNRNHNHNGHSFVTTWSRPQQHS